ncbi:hypothetical protein OE165_27235, partial [Escherichia coli]|uniref:hypothetical protein n=1 Tax=Escherichia coli TaxID=562 RepID=UPI0021F265E5
MTKQKEGALIQADWAGLSPDDKVNKIYLRIEQLTGYKGGLLTNAIEKDGNMQLIGSNQDKLAKEL